VWRVILCTYKFFSLCLDDNIQLFNPVQYDVPAKSGLYDACDSSHLIYVYNLSDIALAFLLLLLLLVLLLLVLLLSTVLIIIGIMTVKKSGQYIITHGIEITLNFLLCLKIVRLHIIIIIIINNNVVRFLF